MNKNNNKTKTQIIAECAILIAMGTLLAQIKLFRMPSGGSVTCVSMLPFMLIAYRNGTKWGLIAGLANALLQIATGGVYMPPAGNFAALAASVALDYILAYLVLGLAEAFRKPFSRGRHKGYIASAFLCCFLRFVFAFISGFLVWGSIAADGFGAVTYSLTYNASYMVPETIITLIVLLLTYRRFV